MTSVYGVTFIGAKAQIKRQLKDLEIVEEEDLDVGAHYLAKTTLESLNDLFQGMHNIKTWLIACAGQIAKRGYPVSWLTPLDLPVVQPYRRGNANISVDTSFQRVTLVGGKEHLPISIQKQKSAFPPNFIHSLDSTHLMLTAIQCRNEGIEFAAVHDSFWTHACDVDRMNELIREQFVELHDRPILDNLLEGFKKRYPTVNFPDVPERGAFDLRDVLDSTYFFA